MTHRTVIRLFSVTLLAALVLGCGDDNPTDAGPFLVVDPLSKGLDEGESVQLTATVGGQPAAVTWVSSEPGKATVSATGLVTGVDACAGDPPTPPCTSGFAAVTATLTSDPTQLRSASITVLKLQGIGLTSGVPVTNLSSNGARGSGVLYRVFVPAGKTSLTVTLRGGTGDADIYVQRQTPPDNSGDATCFSFNAGNDEDCVIAAPASGTWYILIDLFDPYAGATLTATVSP